ncbi:hypothetical protein JCM11641_003150 [Rhodosporidiobolus odoratus]
MSTASEDPKCARCGIAASRRTDTTAPPVRCQLCAFVDVQVWSCNSKCYDAGIERHRKKNCAGEAKRQIVLDDPESWQHFCTPSCPVKLVTPRLSLRPVELTDNERIYQIYAANLFVSSSSQLYNKPYDLNFTSEAFTRLYVTDNVPFIQSISSLRNGRYRYVFVLQPRKDKDGKLLVETKRHADATHDLDAEGYIGNLAIEYTLNTSGNSYFPIMPKTAMEPVPGELFAYPSSQDGADGAYASLFYELHPNFWGQGLMAEAIKEVTSFVFRTLKLSKVVIDPLEENSSSIRLCEKLGLSRVGTKQHRRGKTQVVFETTRGAWEKEREKKAKKSKAKKKKVGGAAIAVTQTAPAVEEEAGDPDDIPLEPEQIEKEPCCLWCVLLSLSVFPFVLMSSSTAGVNFLPTPSPSPAPVAPSAIGAPNPAELPT